MKYSTPLFLASILQDVGLLIDFNRIRDLENLASIFLYQLANTAFQAFFTSLGAANYIFLSAYDLFLKIGKKVSY